MNSTEPQENYTNYINSENTEREVYHWFQLLNFHPNIIKNRIFMQISIENGLIKESSNSVTL
jgi:hypothetical protein